MPIEITRLAKRAQGKAKRTWSTSRASFLLGSALQALQNGKGGRRPFRLLLVSDGAEYTSEQQFAPLIRHKAALRRQLGLVFHRVDLNDVLNWSPAQLLPYDAVGLKISFRTPHDQMSDILSRMEAICGVPGPLRIYFDGDDDQSVQWPEVIEWADLYVKKHAFRDRRQYAASWRRLPSEIKANNLTDYIVDLAHPGADVDRGPALQADAIDKIVVGWNIAHDDKIAALLEAVRPPAGDRDIDVLCRAHVPESFWTYPIRIGAIRSVEALSDMARAVAPASRVSQSEYNDELRRSKIVVSPIGFGEICWRDFEAIANGCLLVKPNMDHVETSPDIYRALETYVPVAWDYSDLRAKCDYYLKHDDERERIVAAASAALTSALEETAFVARFARVLDRAWALKDAMCPQAASATA